MITSSRYALSVELCDRSRYDYRSFSLETLGSESRTYTYQNAVYTSTDMRFSRLSNRMLLSYMLRNVSDSPEQ